MFRRVVATAVALGLALLLGACGYHTGAGGRPTVVAAFYPLQFVAERVVGPHAEVIPLAQPGVEPHDLSLTVRQVAEMSAADVGIYENGFQPAVDQAMAANGPRHVLDVSTIVRLRGGAGAEDAGEADPHFWLDPTLLAKVARSFTATMVRVDPGHAATYRARGAALQHDLAALDRAFRAGLAHCRTRTVVVSHDAFEYLGRRYHLHVVSIAGLTPDTEPSPRHLAQLADLIRSDGITTVFSERLASPQMAQVLAQDVGIRSAVLDPVEGLTPADADQDYLSLMRHNLHALETAGGCS